MKKCIALAVLLLGWSIPTATAQNVGNVITNGIMEPDGVVIAWNNNIYLTDTDPGNAEGPFGLSRVMVYNQDTGLTNFFGATEPLASFAGIVYATNRNSLLVADKGLHRVLELNADGLLTMVWGQTQVVGNNDGTLPGDVTFVSPTALAADRAGNVYVADIGSGAIRKIALDNSVTTVATGLYKPSGLAVDDSGRIYVAETFNHCVKSIETDGSIVLRAGSGRSYESGLRNGAASAALFNSPRGLLWVGGKVGLLVCDTGNRVVRQLTTNNTVATYANMTKSLAPYNLARDENENYVVTDLTGDALRSIQVTAVQPQVESPSIVHVVTLTDEFTHEPYQIYMPVTNITIFKDEDFYTWGEIGTRTFYFKGIAAGEIPDPGASATNYPGYQLSEVSHIAHNINLTPLVDQKDGPDIVIKAIGTASARKSSPVVTAKIHKQVSRPTINGINPAAFTVDLGDSVKNLAADEIAPRYYYTTDGTEPSESNGTLYANGATLNIVNGTNDIVFTIRGFRDTYEASAVVQRKFLFSDLQTGLIGVFRDLKAGSGSTIAVPVQLKLPAGISLRSLQFRVEVKPDGNNEPILDQFRPLSLDPDTDFIPMGSPAADPSTNISFMSESFAYTDSDGKLVRGLTISFISAGANLLAQDFVTVALLAVPMPLSAVPNAGADSSYTISVRYPSATSDGEQLDVPMQPVADRHIVIANIPYLVGDSSTANGYNAGEFGSLKDANRDLVNLANNDVNNAFYASLGIRTPFSFSDVFDAMDAFPIDNEVATGGDGQIRFLDWQIILARALRLDTNNWMRSWSVGGRRSTVLTNLTMAPSTPAEHIVVDAAGKAWAREALLGAKPVENAQPGSTVDVPIYIDSRTAPYVAGLQFRAVVEPVDGAPALETPVRFQSASSLPAPFSAGETDGTLPVNHALTAWSLLQNKLPQAQMKQGTLGTLTVAIPATARAGQEYRVRFEFADGAPDLKTQYSFETLPASIWVGASARVAQGQITDEWKQHFFGSLNNRWSAADADPDGDDVTNIEEYRAGTNPVKLQLRSQFGAANPGKRDLTLRWFARAGAAYTVESSTDLRQWTTIQKDINGEGDLLETTSSLGNSGQLFYRVRQQ